MVSRLRRTATLVITSAILVSFAASPALARKSKKVELNAVAQAAAAPIQNQSFTVDFSQETDQDNVLVLDLSNGGRVVIRLEPKWAPGSVERVKTLTRQGFYDGVIFHRVIEGFMAQTGDPTGTGQGGSKLPDLKAEFNGAPHLRGTVSMARTEEPDSANSQFFIMFMPRFALDRKYTNFGRVIAGMDLVDAIQRGEPPEAPTKILQASILADHKPPKLPGAAPATAAGAGITADMLSKSKSN
ncbi:peptidylprolyl isomerase [Novosphingobium sp.]|uniref:peptidylprolyl isomerase n=1 Tax=Novosphingobium sp. TaxID=1874826 RepID=UPI0025E6141E|nr:peptidylprolyl isomerase [Novosphingobium sp.]